MTPKTAPVNPVTPPERPMLDDKFVTKIPDSTPVRPDHIAELIGELAFYAGYWAEIARFPYTDGGWACATEHVAYMKSQDPRLQTETRTLDDEVVIFARIPVTDEFIAAIHASVRELRAEAESST